MTTDYRALCAELHAALEKHDLSLADDRLLDRSATALRAPLAQPEPQPVPISERLPGPEDCDAENRCWYLCPERDDEDPRWELMLRLPPDSPEAQQMWMPNWTHWLPFNALPIPTSENDFDG